jgi:hypothetical protein
MSRKSAIKIIVLMTESGSSNISGILVKATDSKNYKN